MKKINFDKLDKKQLSTALYVVIVISFLIIFEKVVGHIPTLVATFSSAKNSLFDIISPLIIGFALAYLLNPFIKRVEGLIMKVLPKKKAKIPAVRGLCILFSYFIIGGGFCFLLLFLIPEIQESFLALVDEIVFLWTSGAIETTITNFAEDFDFVDIAYVTNLFETVFASFSSLFQNIPDITKSLFANLLHVGNLTVDIVMGVFIGFYLLYDKERFLHCTKKIIYSISSKEKGDHFLYNAKRVNQIFQNFIIGKALDSLIIGCLAFVGFTILKTPAPLVLSIIIGVCNMIPYFGPFIGGIPVTLFTALTSPMTGLWVGIFILVLQQFDGNVLGPKILGDSVDLSAVMIIVAVVVGGALGGAIGMFIGVPILATIKLFFMEHMNQLYKKKYNDDPPLDDLPL
ncbi:MAG: AI-2E family transporter [Bacillota bacterium]